MTCPSCKKMTGGVKTFAGLVCSHCLEVLPDGYGQCKEATKDAGVVQEGEGQGDGSKGLIRGS